MMGKAEGGQFAIDAGVAMPAVLDAPPTQQRPAATATDSFSESRDALELSKLSAERDKIKLELAGLRRGLLSGEEQQAKKEQEKEKNILELQKLRRSDAIEQEKGFFELKKLRRETDAARSAPYLEFGKMVVPALAIAGTIYASALNISAQQERDQQAARNQRNRDRSVEISQQLVHFQNQITATVEADDKSRTPDVSKQRNAIAAIRSLGKDAIPSLLANLDLDYPLQTRTALHAAVLELNENSELRPPIMRELLTSVKSSALRADIPHLTGYIDLWRECLGQYQKTDRFLFRHASSLGNRLADDLQKEVQVKHSKLEDLQRLVKTIDRLRTKI